MNWSWRGILVMWNRLGRRHLYKRILIKMLDIRKAYPQMLFCLFWRSLFVADIRAWWRWVSVVCYGRVWLGEDWVKKAARGGMAWSWDGPVCTYLLCKIKYHCALNTSNAPAWVKQNFLWVEKYLRRKKKKSSIQNVMSTGKFGSSPHFKEILNCILQISLWNPVTHHTEMVYSLYWDHF